MSETEYLNASARDSLVPLADLLRLAGVRELDAAGVSALLAGDFRRALETAERAVADALPAWTPADFRRACNGDAAVREEVTAWRDRRWNMVYVSELAGTGCDDTDGETWTLLRGSSRFEVREVPRYEVRRSKASGSGLSYVHDNETNEPADDSDAVEALGMSEQDALTEKDAHAVAAWLASNAPGREDDTVYAVWDTDNDTDARDGDRYGPFADYDATDEEDAARAAEAANLEDYRANACGWPFAWHTAAAIDERDADEFAAAGFVVATHEPSGQVYAGIDGGGYDFLEAHWSRVFLAFRLCGTYAPPCIYVPTADGLRRVVRTDDKAGV